MSYCPEPSIVLLRAPLIFFLVVFHVLVHSPSLAWEFGKYQDVTCSFLNPTSWDPSLCKLLGIIGSWAALPAFGQKSLSSLLSLPIQVQHILSTPSSPLTSFILSTQLLLPLLLGEGKATPPRRGCLPHPLSSGTFLCAVSWFLATPRPIPGDLPHPILVGFSALLSLCRFGASTGLSTFSKGFCFSLSLRRINRSRGKYWGWPSGSSQYSREVGQVHGTEREVQIIYCGNLAVREGTLYLERLHRRSGTCSGCCSTRVGTRMSGSPGRGCSLCSGLKTRKTLHL